MKIITQLLLTITTLSLRSEAVFNSSDIELLDIVQKQTFKYFWDFGHPDSGLIRERSNGNNDTIAIGASGFGIMAIIVGADRKWIAREEALNRISKMVNFLSKSDRFHGLYPHWINGKTGKTIPFSKQDDG
jgi:hypothetical protein